MPDHYDNAAWTDIDAIGAGSVLNYDRMQAELQRLREERARARPTATNYEDWVASAPQPPTVAVGEISYEEYLRRRTLRDEPTRPLHTDIAIEATQNRGRKPTNRSKPVEDPEAPFRDHFI